MNDGFDFICMKKKEEEKKKIVLIKKKRKTESCSLGTYAADGKAASCSLRCFLGIPTNGTTDPYCSIEANH